MDAYHRQGILTDFWRGRDDWMDNEYWLHSNHSKRILKKLLKWVKYMDILYLFHFT